MSEPTDNPPAERNFAAPVNWLLGRQLVAGLKYIAAYSLMGDKLNARDWMAVEPLPAPQPTNGEFWFDYLADTGDGMAAVYNIAYLCQSDLTLEGTDMGSRVRLATPDSSAQQLPRGQFLFVGGDCAYHIADLASLSERFQAPFNWAFDDIAARTGQAPERRPIYAIPANHDYYDSLDGFNRQFRRPIDGDTFVPEQFDGFNLRLTLKGFERQQSASFMALDLPFGWKLWGLDTQEGKLDKRQWAYFVSTFADDYVGNIVLGTDEKFAALRQRVPNKLIVATPEPSTVFGLRAEKNGKQAMIDAFKSLGLTPAFLLEPDGKTDVKLPPDQCRLDISGDIHHYERYWGDEASESARYASVVAGGGGAFLHPTHTDFGQPDPAVMYPSKLDSHRVMARRLLNPWNIIHEGHVWLVGALVAALTYLALGVSASTWNLFRLIPDSARPVSVDPNGLLARVQAALMTLPHEKLGFCCNASYWVDLGYAVLWIGLLGYWWWRTPERFKSDDVLKNPARWSVARLSFWWPVAASALPLLLLIAVHRPESPQPLLASALIALYGGAALWLAALGRKFSNVLIRRARFAKETFADRLPLWVLGILTVVVGAYGFLNYGRYPASIMTFNLLVTLAWLLVSVGLVALAAVVGAQNLRGTGKAGFAALGLWHGLLQAATPAVLAARADWLSLALITAVVYGLTWAAGRGFGLKWIGTDPGFAKQRTVGWVMVAAWVLLGVVSLFAAWGPPQPVTGLRLIVASALGAVLSCVWFSWYVAVAVTFKGHNNEAGGGARTAVYRHFIRFRLTEDSLTGYVIGIDCPVSDAKDIDASARLVDQFTLRVPG